MKGRKRKKLKLCPIKNRKKLNGNKESLGKLEENDQNIGSSKILRTHLRRKNVRRNSQQEGHFSQVTQGDAEADGDMCDFCNYTICCTFNELHNVFYKVFTCVMV